MNTDKTALAADVDLQSVDVAENLLDADNGSSQAFGPTEATTRTATPTTNHLGQDPVRSASDHYISLDISRDSDDYKKKSVYHKTTTQIAKAYAAIMKEEEALSRTMADMRLPGPIPAAGPRDIEQCLMGDYEGHYLHEENEKLFRMPEASYFEQRLENSKVDNLNMDSAARKYRFLVPFMIKAELCPGLAFAEGILSWIHFLSLLSLLLNGVSTVAAIFGAASLFLSLTIVHFWYGMSRYPSIWNNMVPGGLKGAKLDENFADIRDVCSYHYNGSRRSSQQLGAFVISLPFTFVYHVNSFLMTLVYYIFGVPTQESRFPRPVTLGIMISNVMMLVLWCFGGPIGLVLATGAKIFNQNFYNALLFKRGLKDFLLSFVFGNVLDIQRKRPEELLDGVVIETGKVLGKSASTPHDIEKANNMRNGVSNTQAKIERVVESGVRARNIDDRETHSISTNSLVEQRAKVSENGVRILVESYKYKTQAPNRQHTAAEVHASKSQSLKVEADEVNSEFRELEGRTLTIGTTEFEARAQTNHTQEFQVQRPSSPFVDDSLSDHQLKHLTNVPVLSAETEGSGREKSSSTRESNITPIATRNLTSKHVSESSIVVDSSEEFLNPSDVYLDIENHPGTVAFRGTISDSIDKFPLKAYTFRKHNWIMRKLTGRFIFVKEEGKRRRKLGRGEIKKQCKQIYDKQILLRSEIVDILNDLKDLKSSHTNSKSNSDHSRHSKTLPLEIDETGRFREEPVDFLGKKQRRWTRKSLVASHSAVSTKDSNVESLVESSKESTVSTLTQSNGTFSLVETGARSTPWIEGPADQLRALNEPTPNGDSTHLREAINGLLEYTSWLENLNPLRESQTETTRGLRSHDEADQKEKQEKISHRQDSGLLTEEFEEVNTGDPALTKEACWQGQVNETTENPKKTKRGKPIVRPDNGDKNSELPKTINWNKDTKEFVDTADVKSKAFPLWRRALRKHKEHRANSRSINEPPTGQEKKKRGSFWRKRNSVSTADVVEGVKEDRPSPNASPVIASISPTPEIVHDLRDERLDDDEKDYRGRARLPGSMVDEERQERQHHMTPTQQTEYDKILNSLNDDVLEKWGGESFSVTRTHSAASSKYVSLDALTKDSLRDASNKSEGFCFDNSCNPMEGFTEACVLQNASSDHDDIYENE